MTSNLRPLSVLLVMALMCSTLMPLLFSLRGRLAAWQKEAVKW